MSAPVFVKLGLATPLGLGTRATQCAIAAGLTGFALTEVTDLTGDPVRACRLSQLDPTMTREERMLHLGQRALAECLADVDPRRGAPIAAYLALPEQGAAPLDEARIVRGLRAVPDAALPLDWSARPIRAGRAGVFLALEAAAAALASGRAALALVGGVDSQCDDASLQHLAAEGRTLGKTNPDGLIPGEGAGFALLARVDATSGLGAPRGHLVACSTARDALPFRQRSSVKAVGLTTLFRQLRHAHADQPRPQHLFSCQPGEGFWARELASAYLRNAALMPEPFRKSTIAASLGDAGAGAGIVQIAMAFDLFATSWRTGRAVDRAIVYGAADLGQSGGCIVAR